MGFGAIGAWVKRHRQDIWLGVCVVLVGWSAYNLGHIRGRAQSVPAAKATVSIQNTNANTPAESVQRTPTATIAAHTDARVVASKASSSKKYYFSWCSGVSRIKEMNRIWFQTAQVAQAAGYTLATNCH